MGCCGDKRRAWLDEIKASSGGEIAEKDTVANTAPRPDRVFEYTGNSAMTIHGAVSGRIYQFRSSGDKVTVDYHDAFAMMAEAGLKILL